MFDQLHQVLLGELNAAGRIDWTRAVADGGHLRAKKGARVSAHRRWIEAGQARSIT
ncbi:hypothetical protein HNR73_006454 [Phytomonospora endophytica]|uniref:Uncharacterized protein n=1 Tax=Phytomonospora endophytica TaxID=714109 RepID=A0A841FXX7_9ACTN|nr:hypothetical protein [Phytomonospora endophytica]